MSIQPVAREAGVSVATVSRAFNLPETVRGDARTRGARRESRLRAQRQRPHLAHAAQPGARRGAAHAAESGFRGVPAGHRRGRRGGRLRDRADDDRVPARRRTARGRSAARAASVDGVVLVVSNPASSVALRQLRGAGLPLRAGLQPPRRHPCVSVDGIEGAARRGRAAGRARAIGASRWSAGNAPRAIARSCATRLPAWHEGRPA